MESTGFFEYRTKSAYFRLSNVERRMKNRGRKHPCFPVPHSGTASTKRFGENKGSATGTAKKTLVIISKNTESTSPQTRGPETDSFRLQKGGRGVGYVLGGFEATPLIVGFFHASIINTHIKAKSCSFFTF